MIVGVISVGVIIAGPLDELFLLLGLKVGLERIANGLKIGPGRFLEAEDLSSSSSPSSFVCSVVVSPIDPSNTAEDGLIIEVGVTIPSEETDFVG